MLIELEVNSTAREVREIADAAATRIAAETRSALELISTQALAAPKSR